MTERFRTHLAESGLIPDGSRLVLGYSGGADSTCLLHLCAALKLDVVAAHLHHGQRPEADAEQEACADFAESLGVPFVTGRADVPAIAQDYRIGLEEAGRKARYEFLRSAAWQTGSSLIATAHTRDDHVETVLLHLTRGCGLAGLVGISAQNDDVVRPILPFSRSETREYCQEHQLWFHDDPANADVDFSRARIRHRVLPELRIINSGADEAIARLAAIAASENAYLDGISAAALESCEKTLNGPLRLLTYDQEVAFHRRLFLALPEVLGRRGLLLVTALLGQGLSFRQVTDVMDGTQKNSTGSVTAEGGEVVVEWDPDMIHVRSLVHQTSFRHPLTVPGETLDQQDGWRFVLEPWPTHDFHRKRGALEAVIDSAEIKGSLYVRPTTTGERIEPLGLNGSKLISDIYREMGLTELARRRLPLVCDLVGPVWVPGGPIAQRVSVSGSTGKALRICFGFS
jgi:tRNA(Ile)-lysidine synthase